VATRLGYGGMFNNNHFIAGCVGEGMLKIGRCLMQLSELCLRKLGGLSFGSFCRLYRLKNFLELKNEGAENNELKMWRYTSDIDV